MPAGTAVGAVFLLAFALAVGGGLLLYALVRREHDDRREMSRAEAERVARRDTRESASDRTAGGCSSTGWDGRSTRRDDDRPAGWDDRPDDRSERRRR